ncbi:MAG: hypothetical protein ACE5JL_17510 [Dehalococcoidia bacterium]
MTQKNFDIVGKKAAQASPSASDMEQFISGSEPQTTMTVQLPERLKFALKRQALDRHTTVKNLLIEILEAYFAENK